MDSGAAKARLCRYLIAIVAGLTIAFLNGFNNSSTSARGATDLQGALSIARSEALRSRRAYGVRLIPDPANPTQISQLQYIEQPDDFFGGRVVTTANNTSITLPDVDLFGGFGATDPTLWPVQPGDFPFPGMDSNSVWTSELSKAKVPDLWEVPEFRYYCRPFAPVTDASGAPVQNATMVLRSAQCKCSECETPECKCCPQQVVVNIQRGGRFTFTVPHGTYVLEVDAGGLKAQINVDLNQGEARTVDVTVK